MIYFKDYLPLDASDYNTPPLLIEFFMFHYDTNPIETNSNTLRYKVQEKVNDGCILQLGILYKLQDTDWDHEIDGREFSK